MFQQIKQRRGEAGNGIFIQFAGNEPSILYLSMLSSDAAFMARKRPCLTVHVEIGNCLAGLIVTPFGLSFSI